MPTFMIRRFLKKLLLPPMVVVAAAAMFIEEWLWDHLAAAMAWIARAPFFRRLEAKLAALHPYAAMVVFLVPGAMLLPVKIGALYLIAHGHAGLGLLLILAAKFLGTAIAARLFTVCRPALLTVRWFRWTYQSILRLKTRLYAAIKAMPGWATAVRWKNEIKARLSRGGHFIRRWKAIGLLLRRRFSRKR